MADPATGLVYYVVFLFSTTLHEAAHAWVAKLGGDLTAYRGGQVSLDPRPHIRREPFGMVVLPVISVILSGWPFGFASAPYDPQWAARHPKRAAWMALAGPAANLVLVTLAVAAIRIGAAAGVFEPPVAVSFGRVATSNAGGLWAGAAFFLGVLFSLNLVLAALNLLPMPPLDGSGAVPLFLSRSATARYQAFLWSQPGLAWIGILIAWQVFDRIYLPLFLFAVNLLYPGTQYS
jgi:Zn-dependent protease